MNELHEFMDCNFRYVVHNLFHFLFCAGTPLLSSRLVVYWLTMYSYCTCVLCDKTIATYRSCRGAQAVEVYVLVRLYDIFLSGLRVFDFDTLPNK